MSNSQIPLNDTDFWWLRHIVGLAIPIALAVTGICSVVTLHSYTFWRWRGFVPVEGKQAVLMGMAYLGLALAFFANYYAQFHKKMGFHYQWILGVGALLICIGSLGCSWLFISR